MAPLFAATLLVSATLLFLIQPMFAKMVLPLLGGTPSVWNTCMVFYQAVLLGGYLYAHFSVRWLGPRRQALLHLALLTTPWMVLPLALASGWTPPAQSNPIGWLLLLLAVSIGLPFFVVSSTAPLLQAWFADTAHASAKDPYYLYSASNLGSMLALLGYPTLVEPWLPLASQTMAWTIGYGLLAGMVLLCALALWRSPRRAHTPAAQAKEPCAVPSALERLRWVALAFVPSSLLLGVTSYISTDIAAVPLMWVVPLALYLLTFVLVFAQRPPLPHRWMLRVQPFFLILLAACLFANMASLIVPLVILHLSAFFVVAMVCHGELAATRPAAQWLTEFYLWMSVGGVLGGLFNAILAPLLFSRLIEYPAVLVAACLLRPTIAPAHSRKQVLLDVVLPGVLAAGMFAGLELLRCMGDLPNAYTITLQGLGCVLCLALVTRPLRFALGLLALLVLAGMQSTGYGQELVRHRSFFGIVKVKRYEKGSPPAPSHVMVHGSTNHGTQVFSPQLQTEPLTYYHRRGPLGQIFHTLGQRFTEVGVIGLGTGSIAAYGRPGMRQSYYEIDPVVLDIARDPQWFTYLRDSRAKIDVVLGDARLTLTAAKPGQFDLLVLDAFSSDAIPMHLITREALQLYLSKLADDGVLALHISNRYLDLAPIWARLAEEEGVICREQYDSADEEEDSGKSASHWVLMARQAAALAALQDDPRWKPIQIPRSTPLWTDDFSNILSVMKWW